jgi:hypothetical protein
LPDCDQKTTPNGRWVYARDLQIGDVMQSRSFGEQKISDLAIFVTKTLVYNFIVDDLHNYLVGKNGVLVHNTNSPPNEYMIRKSGLSGKDAATDVPSFARGKPPKIGETPTRLYGKQTLPERGKPPKIGETPTQYAERLLIERYGEKWRTIFKEKGKKITGSGSEFSQIEKAWRGYFIKLE